MGDKLPRRSTLSGVETIRVRIPATLIAAEADTPIYENNSLVKETVVGVRIIPQAAMSGNTTNHATIGVVNKELAGAGTVQVAPQKAYVTGTDLVAFDADTLPVSATAADVNVEKAEVLALSIKKVGSGLVTPDLVVEIDVEKAGQ